MRNEIIDWHSKIIPDISGKKSLKDDEIFLDDIISSEDKNNSENLVYTLSKMELLQVDILINSFLNIVNSSVYLSNYSKFNEIDENRIWGKYLYQIKFKNLLKQYNINTYEYAILKVNFYYKNGYQYNIENYNKNFPKDLEDYIQLGEDGKRKYLFTLLVNTINRVDKIIHELNKLGENEKNMKSVIYKEINFFVHLKSKWETLNRIPFYTDVNIKKNIKQHRQLIKENLFKNLEGCENNILKINPKFKIINYNTNKEPQYKLIIDINLILDLFRYFYGDKKILIEKGYEDLMEKLKYRYINSNGVMFLKRDEKNRCLINIYNFFIRNDFYYGHNLILGRFQKINKRYQEFTQRYKNLGIFSLKEGEIFISSICSDDKSININKIIQNDENIKIPDYIYWKNRERKGKFYKQNTDNFFILQPSYSYSMELIQSLKISNVKSMYMTDRQNELLYYKKNFIYKCDIHGLINYCDKNKIKLNVDEEILKLDGFFIEYTLDELTKKLKFNYGEKEYFTILNLLYIQNDYNTKIYKEQDNIIDDIDSNEKGKINIINNKSIRRSSILDGEANISIFVDHEIICYRNKYNIINKIFHDPKFIKNECLDIPRDANYFDFIDELNWQLELFSHIKIFGLRNPIFYVFLYKKFILDEKYRDELSEEMIEKYNKYLLFVSDTYDGIFEFLDIKEQDIIKQHINREMEIFERDCKIIDIILFGGIEGKKNLTVPSNMFIWDKELEIIFGEYVLVDPQIKENNRKKNLEMEPNADKLNQVKSKLKDPYLYLYISARGGILDKYIILQTLDAFNNKRSVLTKQQYEKKFKNFKQPKLLNIQIRYYDALKSNYMAFNLYKYWFYIEPEERKNYYLLFYNDKLSEEKNVNADIIIKKFNDLDIRDREFYYKLEHLEYILYNFLLYRYNKFELYFEKHHPYDEHLLVQNVEETYQTTYTKNYREAFLLFFLEEYMVVEEIEEDDVEKFMKKICDDWHKLENAKYKYYLMKEEEEKKKFIEDNENYMKYIELIRVNI